MVKVWFIGRVVCIFTLSNNEVIHTLKFLNMALSWDNFFTCPQLLNFTTISHADENGIRKVVAEYDNLKFRSLIISSQGGTPIFESQETETFNEALALLQEQKGL